MEIKIFALLIFLFVTSANAFTLNNNVGAAFEQDEVVINVASAGCTNIAVTNNELLDLVQSAVNRFWNTVPTSRLTLMAGSQVSVSTAYQTDLVCDSGSGGTCVPNANLKVNGSILISCNTNATNFSNTPSVLGVTVPNNIAGKHILGALILINDNAGSSFPTRSRDEQVAIIAHEIGHAIGLGHSEFSDQLMYYQSVASRNHLGWDDHDGASWLYPAEQPFNVCNSVDMETPPWQNGTHMFTGFFLVMLLMAMLKRFKRS